MAINQQFPLLKLIIKSTGTGFSDYQTLPAEAQSIRTFTVLFGNADEESMRQITELTAGQLFDGTTDSLSFIFKQIRGYQ